MTLYKNRDNFAGVSEKIGAFFSKLGLTPNQWTFLSVIVVLIAGWFLINHNFFIGAVFVAISVFLDVVDGAVARHTKTASSRGAYIDTIVDRYVEAIIIFALLFITLPIFIFDASIWLFAYFFGFMMTTYAKASAKEKGLTKNEIRGGFLERSDRVILLTIGLFLASLNQTYLIYIIILLAFLSNITALQRIKTALS